MSAWIAFAFLLIGWVALMQWLSPPLLVTLGLSLAFGFFAMTAARRMFPR